MFLAALSFAYFAKALSGSYMKSTITQLERRFDIPSYLIGIIDGSFEIGEFLNFVLPTFLFIYWPLVYVLKHLDANASKPWMSSGMSSGLTL